MVALLKYSVLRLALFVAAVWVLFLVGAGPLVALVGGAVVSLLLSYVVLRGPRDQLAIEIAERVDRRSGHTSAEEDAAIEDAADEASRTASTAPTAAPAHQGEAPPPADR